MLHIKNLHKSYGAFEVLRGLEMNVNTGDIYGFLGKNGCGKTTLIKSLANLLPHTGNCQLDTITVESVSPKELAR